MRAKIIYPLLVMLVGLAACTPGQSISNPTGMNDQPSAPTDIPLEPQPGDELLARNDIYLDNTEMLILESYPVQIVLVLQGNLPTPCHRLRAAVQDPDEENRISVDVYSLADPGEICIQILKAFNVNLPLGSYPTGHYSIWVNGEKAGEFDS